MSPPDASVAVALPYRAASLDEAAMARHRTRLHHEDYYYDASSHKPRQPRSDHSSYASTSAETEVWHNSNGSSRASRAKSLSSRRMSNDSSFDLGTAATESEGMHSRLTQHVSNKTSDKKPREKKPSEKKKKKKKESGSSSHKERKESRSPSRKKKKKKSSSRRDVNRQKSGRRSSSMPERGPSRRDLVVHEQSSQDDDEDTAHDELGFGDFSQPHQIDRIRFDRSPPRRKMVGRNNRNESAVVESIEAENLVEDQFDAFLGTRLAEFNDEGRIQEQQDFQRRFLAEVGQGNQAPSVPSHLGTPNTAAMTVSTSSRAAPFPLTLPENEEVQMENPPAAAQERPELPETEDEQVAFAGQFAKEQGERFQDYLKQTGQVDEQLAAATAVAFEAFLKSHVAKPEDDGTGMTGKTIEAAPDDVSELGNSFMGGDWDDGTFVSYSTLMRRQMSRKQQPQGQREYGSVDSPMDHSGGEWGPIRRNEEFVQNRRSMGFGSTTGSSKGTEADHSSDYDGSASHYSSSDGTSITTSSAAFERPFHQQWASLSITQRSCVTNLKKRWERRPGNHKFPDEWYLRFAKCSPGRPYNAKGAYRTMKQMDRRYLGLSIRHMERQLRTKTLFPVPGLKSAEGYDMFYMRPSRYVPKEMSVDDIIDNLVYVMTCMLEKEQACTDGIGFIANMTDWKMSNFTVPYCHKFMMSLQGRRCPTRVGLFLIVNYPSWFGSIWSIMRPMLSEEFRKKVHMIKLDAVPQYFAPGFEQFLPDDMWGGQAPTAQTVREFIEHRKTVEASKGHRPVLMSDSASQRSYRVERAHSVSNLSTRSYS